VSGRRPRLLDLFCGAGGCSVGYHRAGFDVVGVDLAAQPRYPFTFVQGDSLEHLAAHGHEFDMIHASPPCQAYTKAAKIHNSAGRHPNLVGPCRELLIRSGRPWVIENVVGAPMGGTCITLCGVMFGLKVFRHRLFESSILLFAPAHPPHPGRTAPRGGYSTAAMSVGGYVTVAGNNFIREEGATAMGVEWMGTRREVANAIPPAYTEFIGKQLVSMMED